MRCPSCKELLDLTAVKFCPACGVPIDDLVPPDSMIGQVIAQRYRVTHLLAEGGMGRVYAAEQSMGASVRKVAIKLLLAEYSGREQDVQRLSRECSTVAELEHPNTIKFYDYGETRDGDLFIAMEFLSGESLSQILKAGPMSPERVDRIAGQICGSLHEAHSHGIVHRDIKPDNVILTSPGGAPDFVKVLDFGIAKRVGGKDPKLTPLGVVLGSPPYMSPEQFTMQEVDHRSDIYSFGVVLYQMLTGKLPFNASDPIEWAALHMGAKPTPIDSHGVPIPPSMRTAIHRALSKEAFERQQTMRELYGELTIGAGTLEPSRLSSIYPLFASQPPLSPVKAPSAFPPPASGSDPGDRRVSSRASSVPPGSATPTSDRETKDAIDRESEVATRVREEPDFVEELPTRVRPPEEEASRDPEFTIQEIPKEEAPETSRDLEPPASVTSVLEPRGGSGNKASPATEVLDPSALIPSPSPSSPLGQPSVGSRANDPPTIRDPHPAGQDASDEGSGAFEGLGAQRASVPVETAALKADKGTIVMAASEPPPKKVMPDLIPPTLRDPTPIMASVRNASRRTLLWVAVLLVGAGAVFSAVGWFFFLRKPAPARPKKNTTRAAQTATDQARPSTAEGPKPSAPAPAATGAPSPVSAERATPVETASPEPGKQSEKLSPCQTAIFAAVSGKCDMAKRAYARCADDSPYRASATRAVNGLCPQ